MPLTAGSQAPDFSAHDADGREIRLSDLKSKWVLLYFYPRDFTPGCTLEACTLDDHLDDFEKAGAVVIGASSQNQASHRKFQAKHNLRFSLVADTDRSVGDAYMVPLRGAVSKTSARVSFLIDPNGKIRHVWDKVSPAAHAEDVLQEITRQSKS